MTKNFLINKFDCTTFDILQDIIETIGNCGLSGDEMNAIQIAAYFENSIPLLLLLRYLQEQSETTNEENQKQFRHRITQIIHSKISVKGIKVSLIFCILNNQNLISAHSIMHELENYILKGNSMDLEKCVFIHMSSSKLSKKTLKSVKELNPKRNNSCWFRTKWFLYLFSIVLPIKLLPFTSDVVTDTILLFEYQHRGITSVQLNQTKYNETVFGVQDESSPTLGETFFSF